MLRVSWLALLAVILGGAPAFSEERTLYQASGAWRIDGVISHRGRFSYVLTSSDDITGVALEFMCQPAEGANAADMSGLRILGPFGKRWWKFFSVDSVFVSFSVDGAPPSQAKAAIFEGRELVFGREAIGVGAVMRSLRKARNNVQLSIQGVPANIAANGFARLEPIWERLCIGGTRPVRLAPVRAAPEISILDK